MTVTIKEGYRPGCIGRLVQLHAEYYAASSGFGVTFETRVAHELFDFSVNYKLGRDGIWLVECNGCIEGSVVIDGANAKTEEAYLRWFILSPIVKRQGVGKRLLQETMYFADSNGFEKTHLWTIAELDAARRLYESCHFKLVHQNPGTLWGTLVNEQHFVRNARPQFLTQYVFPSPRD